MLLSIDGPLVQSEVVEHLADSFASFSYKNDASAKDLQKLLLLFKWISAWIGMAEGGIPHPVDWTTLSLEETMEHFEAVAPANLVVFSKNGMV